MLSNLATFLHSHRWRVLAVAVVMTAVAGAFGIGVSKHLSPYGANDPATQSVQATNRFQSASGREIDAADIAGAAKADFIGVLNRETRHDGHHGGGSLGDQIQRDGQGSAV